MRNRYCITYDSKGIDKMRQWETTDLFILINVLEQFKAVFANSLSYYLLLRDLSVTLKKNYFCSASD